MSWRATVLTIFPEMLPGPLAYSLAGKALKAGLWRLETVDIRDFAYDKHRSVDDAPFGGGRAGSAHVASWIAAQPTTGVRSGGDVRYDINLRPLRRHRRARAGSPRCRGGEPRRLC